MPEKRFSWNMACARGRAVRGGVVGRSNLGKGGKGMVGRSNLGKGGKGMVGRSNLGKGGKGWDGG